MIAKLSMISLSLLFYSTILFGQNSYQITGKSLLELRQEQFAPPALFSAKLLLPLSFDTNSATVLTQKIKTLSLSKTYWEELGFFCKMEIKMEQKARFPVKFRLGTVDYVDRLEGKYD